jgi:hypothetical protein
LQVLFLMILAPPLAALAQEVESPVETGNRLAAPLWAGRTVA